MLQSIVVKLCTPRCPRVGYLGSISHFALQTQWPVCTRQLFSTADVWFTNRSAVRGLCPELSRVYSAAEAMATMLRAHQLPQFIAAMETGDGGPVAQSICVTVKISLCLLTSVTVVMSQIVAALARTT